MAAADPGQARAASAHADGLAGLTFMQSCQMMA